MEQYDRYKDSGIAWLENVPNHWDVVPYKRAVTIKNGRDYKEVQVNEGGFPVIGSGGEFAKASNYLYDGEVILMGRKGTINKPVYFKGKFWSVDTMFYCIPRKAICGKYIYYQATIFPFNLYSTSTALPSMTQSDLCNNPIVLPPLAEQQQIATYLDAKTEMIDKMIAKAEKKIEYLGELKQSLITRAVTRGLNPNVPLKDSGVKWIGEVPRHWDISRIKFNAKITGRVGFKGYKSSDLVSEGKGAITLGGKHISKNAVDLSDATYINWEKYYESPEIMIRKGDIVTAQRGTLGKSAIIEKEIGEATINPSLILLNNIKMCNKYLYWYLVSDSVLTFINILNTSTAVPMISQSQFSNITVPFPPLSEQQQIATYLDTKCSKIDRIVTTQKAKIAYLQELKQSLVTNVVTGKIKVG